MLYTSSSLPLILFNTFIEFLAEYVLTQKYLLDVAKVGWQAPLGDGQAGLFHWKLWMRYCILPSSWRKGKHFPFLYSKSTVVIPFLLLHNQLLIINNNQWKSITFRRIGEWLSIFIDWLSQSIQSIDFYWFLFIILIEINDLFSLIGIVGVVSNWLGLRQCARCHALRNVYWGRSIPGIGWKRTFAVSLGVFSHGTAETTRRSLIADCSFSIRKMWPRNVSWREMTVDSKGLVPVRS